ncbi:hypothetical protein HDU90_008344 [Geranomyces variabilis]|nr:hypothetical protein HDU90_008344 [Geranomyces variabilis]
MPSKRKTADAEIMEAGLASEALPKRYAKSASPAKNNANNDSEKEPRSPTTTAGKGGRRASSSGGTKRPASADEKGSKKLKKDEEGHKSDDNTVVKGRKHAASSRRAKKVEKAGEQTSPKSLKSPQSPKSPKSPKKADIKAEKGDNEAKPKAESKAASGAKSEDSEDSKPSAKKVDESAAQGNNGSSLELGKGACRCPLALIGGQPTIQMLICPTTPPGTLEKGQIYFFYRPKVELKGAHSLDEVQRFKIILLPTGGSAAGKRNRIAVLSRKRLPHIARRERTWGFVEKATSDVQELDEFVKSEIYETKTRGTRHLEAMRPCGEGVYAIVEHNGHTHLAYALAMPETPSEVQKTFNIESQGSFIFSVKNPDSPSPPWAGLSGKSMASFPAQYMDLFRNRRFVPVNPASFLDSDHAEFLLIGANEDVAGELGEAGQELMQDEEDEHKDVVKLQDDKVFQDLQLEKSEFKAEPLFGDWA